MARREASGRRADSLSPHGDVGGRELAGGGGAAGESWERELGIWVKGRPFYQLSKPRENQEATVEGIK